MKNKKILLLVLASLVFVVVFVLKKKNSSNIQEIGSVQEGPIVEAIYGLGTIVAENIYQVKIGVIGTVERILVKEGQFAKKGQRLISIDGGTYFSAPFDGIVTSVPFKEGETVYPQFSLLTLMDLEHRYVQISLDQQSAMKVKVKMPVTLSFDGFRGEKITSEVSSVYPNDNQFFVRVDAKNLPASVLPGMTVDAAIEIAKKEKAKYVPFTSVQKGIVIVGTDSSQREVKVNTGLIDSANIEILNGDLSVGEKVFVRTK